MREVPGECRYDDNGWCQARSGCPHEQAALRDREWLRSALYAAGVLEDLS